MFVEPSIWNIKMLGSIVLIGDGKVDRHLHFAFAFKGNGKGVFIDFFGVSNAIINGFGGFHPLVEKPVKVYMGKLYDAISKIFEIGVSHFPLVKIMLHGG